MTDIFTETNAIESATLRLFPGSMVLLPLHTAPLPSVLQRHTPSHVLILTIRTLYSS